MVGADVVAGPHRASGTALRHQRVTNAAQQVRTSRSKSSFVPSHRKFRPAAPYTNYKINHAMIVGDFMTARYVLADVATKAAYFSLVAAAFIFVSMLLLTGLHP